MIDTLRPVVKATLVAWLGALAFFEWGTLVVTWAYLDWRRVPPAILALWCVRAPLYVAATWGVWRDRRWALALSAVLGLSSLVLAAPPWGDMDHSQFFRRAGALCGLIALGLLARRRAS